jgi:nitrate reductase cytochrome c-type subunit
MLNEKKEERSILFIQRAPSQTTTPMVPMRKSLLHQKSINTLGRYRRINRQPPTIPTSVGNYPLASEIPSSISPERQK